MNKNIQIFVLSDKAVLFIKRYVLEELNISLPIDENVFSEIEDKAVEWECDMIDINGYDKEGDYPEKERNEMADMFVSELSGHWANDDELDYDDLNIRLGLK